MTNRCWHLLRTNKSATRPTRHLFVDVESRLVPREEDIVEHQLRFGWCCYWLRRTDDKQDQEAYTRFGNAPEFWALVTSRLKKKDPLYIVAHNVQYDFGVLGAFTELKARGFRLRSLYLGQLSCILSLDHERGRVCVLDNTNYFPGKLAELGVTLGYPKLDVDPLTANDAELDPYCRRDVEIMVRAWQSYYKFLDLHDLGNWGKTVPSQAFNAYRHRFMPHPIFIHASPEALALERAAYHGGRCSVWHQGVLTDGPYYKLDVNSMYPYVMSLHEYPSAMYGLRQFPTLDTLRHWLNDYALVARCMVDTDEAYYPVRQGQHILYPVGRFEATLSTPEISHALDHGHLESCSECVLYRHAPLFKEYVGFFHDLKTRYGQDKNDTYRYLTKLCLNSLYGKFGQMHHEWARVDDPDLEALAVDYYVDMRTGLRWALYRIMGETWSSRVVGEANNSFPAIAAHVTAYARDYLWTLREVALPENCFYCDTDSLFVNQAGYTRLESHMEPDRLGGLKVEAVGAELEIQAPKVYRLGDTWKRKGIRKDALEVEPGTFEQDRFASFRTQFRWPGGEPYHTTRVRRQLSYRLYDGVADAFGQVTPVSASDLRPELRLSLDEKAEVADLLSQIEALTMALPVNTPTLFRLWDHRKGTWKRGRDRNGELVSLEYSDWDSRATELGFADLNALQAAALETLRIRRHIAELSQALAQLREPHTPITSPEPMPF